MVLSLRMQEEVLAGMRAHRAVVAKAAPRVESRMTAACALNIRNRRQLTQHMYDEHAKHPTEPLTLRHSMSFNTLRAWRMNLEAHRRRCRHARGTIDDKLAKHVLSYKQVRCRRREQAQQPFHEWQPSHDRTVRSSKDPHEVIMNAWQPVSAGRSRQRDDRRGRVATERSQRREPTDDAGLIVFGEQDSPRDEEDRSQSPSAAPSPLSARRRDDGGLLIFT